MENIYTGIGLTILLSCVNFIATKVYNRRNEADKSFFWQDKQMDILKIQQLEFNELKRKTRIVVIDDEDSFPVELFRNEGYSIDKWDSVKDYGLLEAGNYDIIVLDIKGIALHISEEDGLGVLESLKKSNPAQIIVAFSQHSFDLSKSKFWELADEKLAKPSDFLKIKRVLDNLIKTQFKPERYLNYLDEIYSNSGLHNDQIKKIKKIVEKSIVTKTKISKEEINSFTRNIDLTNKVLTLTNVIAKIIE